MKVKKYFFEIIYFLFYAFTILALGRVLDNYKDDVTSIETLVLKTTSPVISITIFTVTIVLILFRLSHITKYNVPQVVIMKIKYYRLMIVTAVIFALILLMVMFVLYVDAGYVNSNSVWYFLTILELSLITFVFLLIYLLVVSIKLMYQLKAGGDGYDILFGTPISQKDFLTVVISVEGKISRQHAKELVYNILNAEHNAKLRAQILETLDYRTISKVYNFEVKYQLLKFWWNENKLSQTITRLKSRPLEYKEIKAVLNDYEDLIVEYICEDIKKTTIYKYKKSYLFERLITEVFVLTEKNLDKYENFRTYVYVCEFMDNLVYKIIERCSDNKSELIKYYVDYLITVKESFTEDIWFDIICEKLLTCENNSKVDNLILLKCILNSCNKHGELYFSKENIGYYTHLLNLNHSLSIKYDDRTKIYFENNTIVNLNSINEIVDNDIKFLQSVSLEDFCKGLLLRRGYKDITDITQILNVETKHSTRIYDLLLEANDKLTKNLDNSENGFVVIDSLYTTQVGSMYVEKIEKEFYKHKVVVENLEASAVYQNVEERIKIINSRYYRCIKLLTAYSRVNIDRNSSHKSLLFLEILKKEEVNSVFETIFSIISQVSLSSKYNLLNPMLFIFSNLVYYSNRDIEIDLKYENAKGVSNVLELVKRSVLKQELELYQCTLLERLLHNDKVFAPYINYKHIISSIENEEFRKRNYVIYGLDFSEIIRDTDYKTLFNHYLNL